MIEIRQITTVEELFRSKGAPTGDRFVDAVVWMLMNEPKQNNAEEIAQLIGVKEALLSAVIKLLVGVTLKEMITQWRLWQAVALMIDDPELDDEALAQSCGFCHAQDLGAKLRTRHHTTLGALRHGLVRRNGNYGYNVKPGGKDSVLQNAQRLREFIQSMQEPAEG